MPTAKVISPHSGAVSVRMWKHHHSAAGKGAEQSAAMAGPAWQCAAGGALLLHSGICLSFGSTPCVRTGITVMECLSSPCVYGAQPAQAEPSRARQSVVARCAQVSTIEAQSHLEDRIDDTRSGASGVSNGRRNERSPEKEGAWRCECIGVCECVGTCSEAAAASTAMETEGLSKCHASKVPFHSLFRAVRHAAAHMAGR